MAHATFEAVIPPLFAHEGGYTDDPEDNGNWSGGKKGKGRLIGTKYGISAPTLIANRGPHVTVADMKSLTKNEAIRIYKSQYWDTVRGDDLPAGLDYCVYDFSINSGPGKAARVLQEVIGARVDGVIGPATLAAIRDSGKSVVQMIEEISAKRLAFMRGLRTWNRYKKGWTARVREVASKSKRLAMDYPVPVDHAPEDVPVPPAKPEDKNGWKAWKTPQGVATGVTAVTGAGGILSGTGPVQWALAVVFVIAAATAAYLVIKHFKDAD